MSEPAQYILLVLAIWAFYKIFALNSKLYKENLQRRKKVCRITEIVYLSEDSKQSLKRALECSGKEKDEHIKIAISKLEGMK